MIPNLFSEQSAGQSEAVGHGYWELISRTGNNKEYVGRTNATGQLGYPVGRHLWLIQDPNCDLFVPTLINLTLSRCSEDEFTCADGICIPSWQRCDLVQHCDDLSDELECHTVTASPAITSRTNGRKVPTFFHNFLFFNFFVLMFCLWVIGYIYTTPTNFNETSTTQIFIQVCWTSLNGNTSRDESHGLE